MKHWSLPRTNNNAYRASLTVCAWRGLRACVRACVRACLRVCVCVSVCVGAFKSECASKPVHHSYQNKCCTDCLQILICHILQLPYRYHITRVACPAIPANLICNKFGQRRVVVVGSVLMNMGFVLSTFAKELWMLYFTYGILIGRYGVKLQMTNVV